MKVYSTKKGITHSLVDNLLIRKVLMVIPMNCRVADLSFIKTV